MPTIYLGRSSFGGILPRTEATEPAGYSVHSGPKVSPWARSGEPHSHSFIRPSPSWLCFRSSAQAKSRETSNPMVVSLMGFATNGSWAHSLGWHCSRPTPCYTVFMGRACKGCASGSCEANPPGTRLPMPRP